MTSRSLISAFIGILVLLIPIFLASQDQEPISKGSAAAVVAEVLSEHGVQAARARFSEMMALKDIEYTFQENEFLKLGYELLKAEKAHLAAEIFRMAATAFPSSPNPLFSLARAHRMMGDRTKDRENVEKAFELTNQKLLAEFLKENQDAMARTADQVIERHLAAIGGRDSLLKIKSMVTIYSGFDSIDQETFITRSYKYPHFIRQDNAANGTATATDGERVWQVTPAGWKELTGSNWAYVPDIYGDFIEYRPRGITYTLLGVEAIDRHIYYHLVKKYKDGEERDFYFCAETGLFRMERRDFGVGKDIKSYWDYRRHKGILIPHLFIVILEAGFGQIHGAILKDIRINVPLEDSLFRREDPEK